MKQTGAKKLGLLAYGVPQSAECADGVKASFEKWPSAEIAFSDTGLPFGTTDLSVQVSKMKEAGVDFVTTCMDTNGAITLGRELKRQGVNAPQYLPNGYDAELISKFGDVIDGSYVGIGFVPFESSTPPPGLTDYFQWIDKVPGAKRNELSLAGWMNADLLYQGLKAAGPEFTQASVVQAINGMRNWTADGIGPGIDWTTAHDSDSEETCLAIVKIQGGKFVPQFTEPNKGLLCLDNDAAQLPDKPRLQGPEGNGKS
jgi:ABC-type branched-subunit amino acid transport system substrate-binding protein